MRSLSIPFGMLLGVEVLIFSVECEGFQFLLGCYYASGCYGGTDNLVAFNSFWDATRAGGDAYADRLRNFQFLLGCYL